MTEPKQQSPSTLSEPRRTSNLWGQRLSRFRKHKLATLSFVVILLYFSCAVVVYVSEWFDLDMSIADFNELTGQSYESPNLQNPLGTDIFGRSTLRKTFYGAKTSLSVALFASLICITIGVSLGALAGYFRGLVDEIIVWIYTTLSNIPWIILVMAFAVVLRDKRIKGATAICLAIGFTGWTGICRLVRAEVIKRKQEDYVLAARACGCSDLRIIFRHLLPNMIHVVIVSFSIRFVNFIHMEVILSFLGFGDTKAPSWGAMINVARTELLRDVWWEMAAASLAIFFISLALNIFGDALKDALNPRLESRIL